MNALARLWTVTELELRQRVVSRSFYILLAVFAGALLIVCGLVLGLWGSVMGADAGPQSGSSDGGVVYGTTVYLVLFLATIVCPILSGGAINGDRNAGTLATVQITLATPWQLVGGKFLAAWITSLSLAVVASPFLVVGAFTSRLPAWTIAPTIALLVFELGFLSALGVGFSGLVRSPAFSIVFAYLTLALLSVGSLLAFSLGGLAITSTVSVTINEEDYSKGHMDVATNQWIPGPCVERVETRTVGRWDYVFGFLAVNPYVMIADVTPTVDVPGGTSTGDTMLGGIKAAVRSVQIPPETTVYEDWCGHPTTGTPDDGPTEQRTVPTWIVGALLHAVIGAGLLVLAWWRIRTPAGRLGAGTRIA